MIFHQMLKFILYLFFISKNIKKLVFLFKNKNLTCLLILFFLSLNFPSTVAFCEEIFPEPESLELEEPDIKENSQTLKKVLIIGVLLSLIIIGVYFYYNNSGSGPDNIIGEMQSVTQNPIDIALQKERDYSKVLIDPPVPPGPESKLDLELKTIRYNWCGKKGFIKMLVRSSVNEETAMYSITEQDLFKRPAYTQIDRSGIDRSGIDRNAN